MRRLLVLLAASTWCSAAHADPEAPAKKARFTDEPISLNLVTGVGNPTGELGGTVEYSFTDRFAAGVGAGYGFHGPQFGVSGRLRLALAESEHVAQAFDVVGALSTGHYRSAVFECDDSGCWELQAYWVQAGLDYELQTGHFRLATGVGLAVMAARSGVVEEVSDGVPSPLASPIVIPTAHVTLGFAF